MKIAQQNIQEFNQKHIIKHKNRFDFISSELSDRSIDVDAIVQTLSDFQVAVPSWALGAGGTRFGRFSFGGEPSTLEEKIDDVGLIHALTHTAGAISLHIPWDIPSDAAAIRERAADRGLVFDAVNSNTFQDQSDQEYSYKYGSLCHVDAKVRRQAIDHNIQVVEYGEALGSKSLTVWLADGTSFPGQHNFRKAHQHTQSSLKEIYNAMPDDWKLYIEYKPYEPNFYSMVIPDWGTSLAFAQECGPRAHTLVDLGHHLPNTNIEQIVAILMTKGRLGGFHFNDSKYGDDDLTVGSIKPYQLFLIFNELVYGMENNVADNPPLAWMIDASHNLKDPLEDLMQSLDAILVAYAQALLIDRVALEQAQEASNVAACQDILQQAYRTDVRAIVAESRLRAGAAIDPVAAYRSMRLRDQLIDTRGLHVTATGL